MRDLRVEITDGGTALYLAIDPDGIWAKTTRPDDLITIDWDAQGRVIGIEAIGSPAQRAIGALFSVLRQSPVADPDELRAAFGALSGDRVAETAAPTSTAAFTA